MQKPPEFVQDKTQCRSSEVMEEVDLEVVVTMEATTEDTVVALALGSVPGKWVMVSKPPGVKWILWL